MSTLRFRNVDAAPSDPVESWPLEALQIALERGDLNDHRRIVSVIASDPWGPVARRLEQVLTWSRPYGTTNYMERAIARARERWGDRERAWVRAQLYEAIMDSGLTQAQFAGRLGTSGSRLSTYLSGKVVPSATLLARAHAVAEHTSGAVRPAAARGRRAGR